MPYVDQETRHRLDGAIKLLTDEIAATPKKAGAANYAVSRLISGAFGLNFYADNVPSYENLNAAIGVLECAKAELYRRIGAEKENKAIDENGDLPEWHDVSHPKIGVLVAHKVRREVNGLAQRMSALEAGLAPAGERRTEPNAEMKGDVKFEIKDELRSPAMDEMVKRLTQHLVRVEQNRFQSRLEEKLAQAGLKGAIFGIDPGAGKSWAGVVLIPISDKRRQLFKLLKCFYAANPKSTAACKALRDTVGNDNPDLIPEGDLDAAIAALEDLSRGTKIPELKSLHLEDLQKLATTGGQMVEFRHEPEKNWLVVTVRYQDNTIEEAGWCTVGTHEQYRAWLEPRGVG